MEFGHIGKGLVVEKSKISEIAEIVTFKEP
jgi:hypothetical protein